MSERRESSKKEHKEELEAYSDAKTKYDEVVGMIKPSDRESGRKKKQISRQSLQKIRRK